MNRLEAAYKMVQNYYLLIGRVYIAKIHKKLHFFSKVHLLYLNTWSNTIYFLC